MVFNGTFNNISVISWRSVLFLEESRVPGENHRPAASPDSSLLSPDSSLLSPDSSLLSPDSSLLSPDSSLLNPDSSLLNPDSIHL